MPPQFALRLQKLLFIKILSVQSHYINSRFIFIFSEEVLFSNRKRIRRSEKPIIEKIRENSYNIFPYLHHIIFFGSIFSISSIPNLSAYFLPSISIFLFPTASGSCASQPKIALFPHAAASCQKTSFG